MEFSAIGRAALRSREGERLTAYFDSQRILTIGIGVTSATGLINITPGMTITAAQSDALFAAALVKYVNTVKNSIKVAVPQEFFDACVSLCYNVGQGGFAGSSIVRFANNGDMHNAIESFLKWNKPAEIMSRRRAEYNQAKTPYSIQMPKGRDNDKSRVSTPGSTAPIPVVTKTTPTTTITSVAVNPNTIVSVAVTQPKPSKWAALGAKISSIFRRV